MNAALADSLRVLRSRWRWMVAGILLTLAATTLLLITLPPVYQSDATVFIRTPGDVSRVVDGGDTYARGRARTYAALAANTSTSARVVTDLGLDPGALSGRIHASNPPGTALIKISIDAPTAEQARQTATVFLTEYSATVRQLESVPGSLAPRAELVVVDPPGPPRRVVAWGAPVSIVLLGATFVGLVCGATSAVLRSMFDGSARPSVRRVWSVMTRAGR